jgi:UPF0176 protein
LVQWGPMEKIILYYKFVKIRDTESVKFWQRVLCERLGLKGRILISSEGINGTLGGDIKALKSYKRAMNEHSLFKGTEYKWSDGSADDFPKLSVKVRTETVTLGLPELTPANSGQRLKPKQFHDMVANDPDVVLFDARNNYESAIGRFKGAVTPDIDNFRDLPDKVDEYAHLKDKKVVTYCTGGIRCETFSALLKQKGFKRVYQLDGGIVKYGEKYGDAGHWEGKCFVFDKRMSVSFSDDAKDIGQCIHCQAKTSNYINCANKTCNKLTLVCNGCEKQLACSGVCKKSLTTIA